MGVAGADEVEVVVLALRGLAQGSLRAMICLVMMVVGGWCCASESGLSGVDEVGQRWFFEPHDALHGCACCPPRAVAQVLAAIIGLTLLSWLTIVCKSTELVYGEAGVLAQLTFVCGGCFDSQSRDL